MSESALPDEVRCLNCGEPLRGIFCTRCGQQDKEVLRPFLYFLREFVQVVFELDGRAYRTVLYLFTRPGFLAREFFAGRRTRYTPPLRLFLVISIGFFLILGLGANITSIRQGLLEQGGAAVQTDTNGAAGEENEGEESEESEEGEELNLQFDVGEDTITVRSADESSFGEEEMALIREQFSDVSLPFLSPEMNENLGRYMASQVIGNIQEIMEDSTGFFLDSLDYLTFFVLLMMPVLALIQKILFVFTRNFYVEHLILTMHNHAFLLIGIFLFMVFNAVADAEVPFLSGLFGYINIALLLWVAAYLYLSLKFYFGRGYLLTGVLFLATTTIYGIIAAIGLAVFAAAFFILA